MMSLVSPYIEPVGLKTFRVKEAYVFEYVHEGERYQIRVAPGFEYDLSSVPFYFRWLVGRSSLGFLAPLIHDYIIEKMREQGFVVMWTFIGGVGWQQFQARWTRKNADKLFFKIMSMRMGRWPYRGKLVDFWRRFVRRASFKLVRLQGAWNKAIGREWGRVSNGG